MTAKIEASSESGEIAPPENSLDFYSLGFIQTGYWLDFNLERFFH